MIDILTIPIGIIGFICWVKIIQNRIKTLDPKVDYKLMYQIAHKYCEQENEIWQETTPDNRKRYLREAKEALHKEKRIING